MILCVSHFIFGFLRRSQIGYLIQSVLMRLIYLVNGLPISTHVRCAQPKTFSLAIDMGCHVCLLPSIAWGSCNLNLPGYKLHELSGKEKGTWSVWVSGNWRVTFQFDDTDAIVVDYRDYH